MVKYKPKRAIKTGKTKLPFVGSGIAVLITAVMGLSVMFMPTALADTPSPEPSTEPRITFINARVESGCGVLTFSYGVDPEDTPVEVYRKINGGDWERLEALPLTRFENVGEGVTVQYRVWITGGHAPESTEPVTTHACSTGTPTPTRTPSGGNNGGTATPTPKQGNGTPTIAASKSVTPNAQSSAKNPAGKSKSGGLASTGSSICY